MIKRDLVLGGGQPCNHSDRVRGMVNELPQEQLEAVVRMMRALGTPSVINWTHHELTRRLDLFPGLTNQTTIWTALLSDCENCQQAACEQLQERIETNFPNRQR